MSNFKKSYELLKKWENRQTSRGLIVYSNIKEDAGGETVLGVARNSHSKLAIWKDIDKIKDEVGTDDLIKLSNKILENKKICSDIEALYKIEYWNKAKCDIIADDDFASNLFLLCVNAGVKRGIKTGQEACKIKADGIIGNMTKKAWMTATKEEAKNFTEIEIRYYKSLVVKNPKLKKFLNGWLERANAI